MLVTLEFTGPLPDTTKKHLKSIVIELLDNVSDFKRQNAHVEVGSSCPLRCDDDPCNLFVLQDEISAKGESERSFDISPGVTYNLDLDARCCRVKTHPLA